MSYPGRNFNLVWKDRETAYCGSMYFETEQEALRAWSNYEGGASSAGLWDERDGRLIKDKNLADPSVFKR